MKDILIGAVIGYGVAMIMGRGTAPAAPAAPAAPPIDPTQPVGPQLPQDAPAPAPGGAAPPRRIGNQYVVI